MVEDGLRISLAALFVVGQTDGVSRWVGSDCIA